MACCAKVEKALAVGGGPIGPGNDRHVDAHRAGGPERSTTGGQGRARRDHIVHQQNALAIERLPTAKGSLHVVRPIRDRQFILHPCGPLPNERSAVRQPLEGGDPPRQLIGCACAADRTPQPMHRDGHDPTDSPGRQPIPMLADDQRRQSGRHVVPRRTLGTQHRVAKPAGIRRQDRDLSPVAGALRTEPTAVGRPAGLTAP